MNLKIPLLLVSCFLLGQSTLAQNGKKSLLYLGPGLSLGIVSDHYIGGYDDPRFYEAVPARTGSGSGYDLSLGSIIRIKPAFHLNLGLTAYKAFSQEFRSGSSLLTPNSEDYNYVDAYYFSFSPNFGLSHPFNSKVELLLSAGPTIGLAGIQTQESVIIIQQDTIKGTFATIDGGYLYGLNTKMDVHFRLSDRWGLMCGLRFNYLTYKPGNRTVDRQYQNRTRVDQGLEKYEVEQIYVREPTLNFSTDEPKEIPQQYFNLSGLGISVALTYSL